MVTYRKDQKTNLLKLFSAELLVIAAGLVAWWSLGQSSQSSPIVLYHFGLFTMVRLTLRGNTLRTLDFPFI